MISPNTVAYHGFSSMGDVKKDLYELFLFTVATTVTWLRFSSDFGKPLGQCFKLFSPLITLSANKLECLSLAKLTALSNA